MCQLRVYPAYGHLRGSWSAEAWPYAHEEALRLGIPHSASWRSRPSRRPIRRRGHAIITADWDGGLPDKAKAIVAEGIRAFWGDFSWGGKT